MRYHYFAITALLFIAGVVICIWHGIGSPLLYLGIVLALGPTIFWVSYGFFFGYFISMHPSLYSMKTKEKNRMEDWFRENNGKALLYAYILACLLVTPLHITKAAPSDTVRPVSANMERN